MNVTIFNDLLKYTMLGCIGGLFMGKLAAQCQLSVTLQTELACPYLFDGVVTAFPTDGTAPFQYEWNTGASVTSVLTGVDVGSYTVTVTDAEGCTAVATALVESVQKPDIAGEVTDLTCYRSRDGTLQIVEADPSLRFSLFGEITEERTFDSLFAGSYSLNVLDTFGCVWVQFFTVEQPDPVYLSLPDEILITVGDTVALQPEVVDDSLAYEWNPDIFISCDDCTQPDASPIITTVYHLEVTDTNGCSARDSIVIVVENPHIIAIPNVFTPNGDGINDILLPLGKGLQSIQTLQIFDRWGRKVFTGRDLSATDPASGWNGMENDTPALPDVYLYNLSVLFTDGTVRSLKGDVLLIR